MAQINAVRSVFEELRTKADAAITVDDEFDAEVVYKGTTRGAKSTGAPKGNGSVHNWCFTLPYGREEQPTYEEALELCYKFEKLVKWAMFAREKAPTTGQPHFQSYVKLVKPQRLNQLTQMVPKAHFSVARGTWEENLVYLTKEDEDPLEFGTRPQHTDNGKREQQVWEETRELAKAGKLDEIRANIFVQQYPSLLSIRRDYEKRPNDLENPCGVWIFGKSGVGKTTYARQIAKEKFGGDAEDCFFEKMGNKWFDNYRGQPAVVWDDFMLEHSRWAGYLLKIWTDKYAFSAEIKGSARLIRPKCFIVTSQTAAWDYFWGNPTEAGAALEHENTMEALDRRFKVIELISHAPFQCIEHPKGWASKLRPASHVSFNSPVVVPREMTFREPVARPETPFPGKEREETGISHVPMPPKLIRSVRIRKYDHTDECMKGDWQQENETCPACIWNAVCHTNAGKIPKRVNFEEDDPPNSPKSAKVVEESDFEATQQLD